MNSLAIVMMQRNEGELLSSWIKYHQDIVAPEDIHILDNNSDDISTLFYLSEAKKAGCNVTYGIEDFEKKGRIVSELIGNLTETYKYVAPLDCDEFIGVLDNSFQFQNDIESIISELDRSSGELEIYLRVQESIWNIPFSTKGYHLPIKKIIVSRMRNPRLDLGFHLYDWYTNGPTVPPETIRTSRICYLHYHNGPFERVITSARRKLAQRLDGFTKKDFENYKGAGKHLLRYFTISEQEYMESFPQATHDLSAAFLNKGGDMPFVARDILLRTAKTWSDNNHALQLAKWTEIPKAEVNETPQGPTIVHLAEAGTATRKPPFAVHDPEELGLCDNLRNPIEVKVSSREVLVLPRSRLFGQRMLASNGHLYSDFELNSNHIDRYINNRFDVRQSEYQLSAGADGYWSNKLQSDPIKIEGRTALVSSSEPVNYGAWLIRVIPKIEAVRRLFKSDVRFAVFAERDWQREILSHLGIGEDRLIRQHFGKTYELEQAVVPNWPNRHKYLDTHTLQALGHIRDEALASDTRTDRAKAIYVSRRSWGAAAPSAIKRREFLNGEEFEIALASRGIKIVEPEKDGFEETIRNFASAELVIGPQGSGLFNCVFCFPGTTVIDIEHLPNFLEGHSNLFASCNLNYALIVARAIDDAGADPVHRSFSLNIPAALAFIDGILEGRYR
ncbi:DUF563 domain-containing protein [Pseudohoeflea suaedae]|uniref:DUF563 domain-containing protein n=1 Tax=Pseudohoeflea suaedae TaxID=877384 RepID=A0A4V3A7G5_9HYPH|nr:glycosyltransferase 61 family protein [Pseudohoeflea suaedae]TDH38735.1 DUF563 domain-containing protein [Pseudohoeflea suaedae]